MTAYSIVLYAVAMPTKNSFSFPDGFMERVRGGAASEHRSLANFIVHAVETYVEQNPPSQLIHGELRVDDTAQYGRDSLAFVADLRQVCPKVTVREAEKEFESFNKHKGTVSQVGGIHLSCECGGWISNKNELILHGQFAYFEMKCNSCKENYHIMLGIHWTDSMEESGHGKV